MRDRGCHDAAVELLASVLRANPRDIEAHRELALVRFAQGRRAWAESLLRRAAMLEEVIAVELAAGAEADDRQSLASDVAYAIRAEQEMLRDVDQFVDWQHDPPSDPPPPAVEADRTGDAAVDAPPRPLLTLSGLPPKPRPRRAADRVTSTESGTVIVWKRRSSRQASDAASTPERREERHEQATVVQLGLFDDAGDAAAFDEPWDEDRSSDWAQEGLAAAAAAIDDEWQVIDDEPPVLADFTDAVGADVFDGTVADLGFDEEAVEAADQPEPATLSRSAGRIELWRFAEQTALELLRVAGKLDDPVGARRDMRFLAQLLLQGAAEAKRQELSIGVRARHIGRLLEQGASLDDVAAAQACRQAWAENPEFHIDLGGWLRGDGWTRKEDVRPLLPWPVALAMARRFAASDVEEFRHLLLEMFEHWNGSWRLQRRFPLFLHYVYYRILPTGCELDELPHCLFDDPAEPDGLERWEDDPVRKTLLKRELENYGLIPLLYRSELDLPAADCV